MLKFKLPNNNDLLVLIGMGCLIFGAYQVYQPAAAVVAGYFALKIGLAGPGGN